MGRPHGLYPLGLAVGLVLSLLAAAPASAQGREADISVRIVRGPRVITPAGSGRFLVRVTNHGPDTARNVRVSAEASLPVGVTRARCRAVRVSNDTCVFREIEEDETVTIEFTVSADENLGGDRSRFRVRADARTFDPDPENNRDARTLRIRGPIAPDAFDDGEGLSAADAPAGAGAPLADVSAGQTEPWEARVDARETAVSETPAEFEAEAAPAESSLEGPEVGTAEVTPSDAEVGLPPEP